MPDLLGDAVVVEKACGFDSSECFGVVMGTIQADQTLKVADVIEFAAATSIDFEGCGDSTGTAPTLGISATTPSDSKDYTVELRDGRFGSLTEGSSCSGPANFPEQVDTTNWPPPSINDAIAHACARTDLVLSVLGVEAMNKLAATPNGGFCSTDFTTTTGNSGHIVIVTFTDAETRGAIEEFRQRQFSCDLGGTLATAGGAPLLLDCTLASSDNSKHAVIAGAGGYSLEVLVSVDSPSVDSSVHSTTQDLSQIVDELIRA